MLAAAVVTCCCSCARVAVCFLDVQGLPPSSQAGLVQGASAGRPGYYAFVADLVDEVLNDAEPEERR